jgi:hypothetical protein
VLGGLLGAEGRRKMKAYEVAEVSFLVCRNSRSGYEAWSILNGISKLYPEHRGIMAAILDYKFSGLFY